MILDPKSTTVAYRCPYCGNGVVSMVGIFSLSAEMLRLKCSCGKSALTIKYERGDIGGDRRIRLTVPCLFCPKPHMYVVSPNVFFNRELFMLQCSATGIDIFFSGDTESVSKRLEDVREELLELCDTDDGPEDALRRLTDFNSNASVDFENGGGSLDPHIVEIMRYALTDMCEAGEVHCKCGDESAASYRAYFEDGVMHISCDACGAKADVPASGIDAATRFLESGELRLE